MDVFDAGLDYPDYLKAEGEDSNASYEGKSPAWAKYHMRQGKRVFMVYGEPGKDRRTHFSETPWPWNASKYLKAQPVQNPIIFE